MIKYVIIAVVIILVLSLIILYIRKRKNKQTEIEATVMKTIVFKTNSIDEIEDLTLEENSLVPPLPTLQKNGYNFKGWYLDQELTKPFPKKYIIEDDITLYAKFEEQTIEEFLDFMNNQNIEKDIIKKVKQSYKN